MIPNHQLESMWKELAMVQFQVLHLVEENEKSYYSLSENSPSEDSKQSTADYRWEASELELINLLNHTNHEWVLESNSGVKGSAAIYKLCIFCSV